MGSIRPWPRDDPDEVRNAFYAQMYSERVQLVALSAALARADEDPFGIYNDLISRAHRLQRGAQMLEITDFAAAANSLEEAASRAYMSRADHTDTPVWTALVALVSVMGTSAAP